MRHPEGGEASWELASKRKSEKEVDATGGEACGRKKEPSMDEIGDEIGEVTLKTE